MKTIHKQTKLWTTKKDTKIRICDMEDSHLVNTIKMLVKYAPEAKSRELQDLYSLSSFFTGDNAQDHIESSIDSLESREYSAYSICDLFGNLVQEADRRELDIEKYRSGYID